MSSSDPLDDVFTLEDRFYTKGYSQGVQDGARAGRIEGRSLGMEKGFQKFMESGRLAGKALVWANRLPGKKAQQTDGASTSGKDSSDACTLPPLPRNPRLEKNVKLAYALVEPDTLSTDNTDEAVQDFDDRLKRAQGKVKIIEKMLG
ncbi:hypothetical protein Trco_006307 [Trichoderma cornu-damae]|uniref:Essential protein Yae1 N-terminal domain-containing protein n=1 Tax=Trichoderma cornu-damae TaxID=654480 RepID=A0A9P8QGJ5_9HYPO|nr:hypothetical protein Trco_006307 [Trichoderma cornu-damae]